MKIAVVSIYPERAAKHVNTSGVASYTKNLVKDIPLSDNDELHIICNKIDGKTELYKEDGFYVERVFDRGLSFVWQIFTQVRKVKPDVVHIQQEVSLYGGIHTAYLLQLLIWLLRPYNPVLTLHHAVNKNMINEQFVAENKSNMPVWAVRAAFHWMYVPFTRLSKHVIVHEQYFKDLLVKQYGAKPEKITVVHHGVENFTPLNKAAARKTLDIPADAHVALFMGYLAGYKGFDLLLEGFAEYAKQDSKAFLVIGAGKHPKFLEDKAYLEEYASKQQKAADLIPANQYRWVGFIAEEDLAPYYSASDVSLFPYTISMSSSGPMSFAIGFERAFLGSDVFKDVLPADVLFARQAEPMAQKIADYFSRPDVFTKLITAMKEARLWSNIGKKTKTVYEEIA
jgi:glycosyltransferase involved in cell wall biosynthesis